MNPSETKISSNNSNDCQKNIILTPRNDFFTRPLGPTLKDIKPNRDAHLALTIDGRGSSIKKKQQSMQQENKGVRVELPFTPHFKHSLWSNLNLYYVDGQENEPFSYNSIRPPSYLVKKTSEKSKVKENHQRPSSFIKTTKTKRTLRFTTNCTTSRSDVKKNSTPKCSNSPSRRATTIAKTDTSRRQTIQQKKEKTVFEDLEELKRLKQDMLDLTGNIQKKFFTDKENIPLAKSRIPTLKQPRTPNHNNSLAAFEMHEQLLKTPKMENIQENEIHEQILQFQETLSHLVGDFEKNLFNHLKKSKNQQYQLSIPEGATTTVTKQVSAVHSHPIDCSTINTPLTNRSKVRFNKSILKEYQELKQNVHVLATPIVDGTSMRLNKNHNLEISKNVMDQLNNLDI